MDIELDLRSTSVGRVRVHAGHMLLPVDDEKSFWGKSSSKNHGIWGEDSGDGNSTHWICRITQHGSTQHGSTRLHQSSPADSKDSRLGGKGLTAVVLTNRILVR